jgi:hypothetical protein
VLLSLWAPADLSTSKLSVLTDFSPILLSFFSGSQDEITGSSCGPELEMLSLPELFEDSEELALTSFSELEHRGRDKLSLSSVEDDDFTFENVSEHGSPAVLLLNVWLSSALTIAGLAALSTFLSGKLAAAFCPPSLVPVSSSFFSLYWTEYSDVK